MWREPDANLHQLSTACSRQLGQRTPCDVVVLPEMFTTGFSWPPVDPTKGANTTVQWMQSWADRLSCAVVGSVGCHDQEGSPRNRCWFVHQQRKALLLITTSGIFSHSPESTTISKLAKSALK